MAHIELLLQVLSRAAGSSTAIHTSLLDRTCNLVVSNSRQHYTQLVRPFSSYATPKAGSIGSSMRRVPISRGNGSAAATADAAAESSVGKMLTACPVSVGTAL